jgi:hypothetical protein
MKARKIQNNIPTAHILEINCYIVKSNNLSTIFGVLYKKYNKNSNDHVAIATQRNASLHFTVDQLLILHVKSGKYRREVAACMYF